MDYKPRAIVDMCVVIAFWMSAYAMHINDIGWSFFFVGYSSLLVFIRNMLTTDRR